VLSGQISVSDQENVIAELHDRSKSQYQNVKRKIEQMDQERLMFDVFIEIQFEDKPEKIVYKVVIHENLILIQHVTVVGHD
jgi:hypothetical protein